MWFVPVSRSVKAQISLLVVAMVLLSGFLAGLRAEELPVIVTYELQKQHQTTVAVRRDPRQFWISQVMTRIEDRRVAPPARLLSGATAQVAFTVSRDGHLVSSAVQTSSGAPAIDDLALGMVRQAQPFPPMPDALADTSMSFVLPVRFH